MLEDVWGLDLRVIERPFTLVGVNPQLRAMMDTPHPGEAGVHPVIASSARELLNKSKNERSGVLNTAMSFLGLYRDPVVARVTARCSPAEFQSSETV